VNCICPGPVDTPLLEKLIEAAADPAAERANIVDRVLQRRLGKPDEIARVILFVASDEASFMTGSVVTVDGGWTAR
jgi:NAD(P)-dependent dehydrogenase (short-subunit alcohol dehydrogenase family)